jgi:hypothetical protein
MDKFVKMSEGVHSKAIVKQEYHIKQEAVLSLIVGTDTIQPKDRIDVLEWNTKTKTVCITEGKIDTISPENLRQLFFYYRNLKYFCKQFIDYSIETRFITLNDKITKEFENELIMLKTLDSEFDPEIKLFSSYGI